MGKDERKTKEIITPEYTRKAIDNYNGKHDKTLITLDHGELAKIREKGITNKVIVELIRNEYQRRIRTEKYKASAKDDDFEIPDIFLS
jgi:hypothetical protein